MSDTQTTSSYFEKITQNARRLVGVPRALASIVPGWVQYMASGKTPFRAYNSMRRLYYLTDGRFNDVVHGVLRHMRPPVPLDRADGVLGNMQGVELDRVLRGLETDGFYVFDRRLSE